MIPIEICQPRRNDRLVRWGRRCLRLTHSPRSHTRVLRYLTFFLSLAGVRWRFADINGPWRLFHWNDFAHFNRWRVTLHPYYGRVDTFTFEMASTRATHRYFIWRLIQLDYCDHRREGVLLTRNGPVPLP